MNADDRVPFFLRSTDDHAIAGEPGVVHEYVEPPEGLDGGADETARSFPISDVVSVGDGFTTSRTYRCDDFVRRALRLSASIRGNAEIVDDDFRALASELQGVGATNAATRAGDDDHPSFADAAHATLNQAFR
jgi:hypothetical protein